jgi:hypothetical protein
MNYVNRSTLTAAVLAASFVVSQSCSKGETNEAGQLTTIVTNNPATRESAWGTDEKFIQGDRDTNGWGCVLRISNHPWLSDQHPPVCQLLVQNISTNTLSCWGGSYGPTYSRIELLDSLGEPVERTAEGKQIGTRTNSAQIGEMVTNRFKEWVSGRARTPGFISIRPGGNGGIGFSIPHLFQIKQPGAYTLKATVCLIQRVGGEEYNPQLKITWLPEITAKLQIRPGGAAK